MNLDAFYRSEFAEHHAVAARTELALSGAFCGLLAASVHCIRNGGKLLFFGNGGSAGDSQHLAAELTVRYKKERAPIAAIALSTDTSAITACGNDFGFDRIFARQIEALGRPGDLALGISTSGRSANVVLALKQAREMGLITAAFGGRDGGELPGVVEHLLIVPSTTTARIQEMHIMLGQMLCGAIEIELGLAEETPSNER